MSQHRNIISRAPRRCLRSTCCLLARDDSEFCSRFCEHEYVKAIESTSPREVVETGEIISGPAYIEGGTHRPNLQNSA